MPLDLAQRPDTPCKQTALHRHGTKPRDMSTGHTTLGIRRPCKSQAGCHPGTNPLGTSSCRTNPDTPRRSWSMPVVCCLARDTIGPSFCTTSCGTSLGSILCTHPDAHRPCTTPPCSSMRRTSPDTGRRPAPSGWVRRRRRPQDCARPMSDVRCHRLKKLSYDSGLLYWA